MSKRKSAKEQEKYAQRLAKIDERRDLQKKSRFQRGHGSAPIGNKLPNLKKQRHWSTTIRAGSLLVVFGAVLMVMVYLVAPVSKINQIEITGNKQVDRQSVLTATKVHQGDFVWQTWWHSNQINIASQKVNPEIRNVKVKVVGLQTVKLVIQENKIVGFLKQGNYYYPILASGHVKKNKLSQPQNGQPVYDGFKSRRVLNKTVRQYSKLSATVRMAVSEIKFQPTKNDNQRIRLFMNDGNEVLIKYSKLTKKMPYYPSIAHSMSKNGVVNLELGAYSYSYGSQEH
ncbi:cell division protein FtsQ/DivIB [Paucilactobacillus kaifaensis]|uniref:cell division protein FtsQ/DivIB n=1 Tax=Paucilactobacillus kaifaensis TaxID=2559921 RepID=UPI0014855F73|nr:cell division protein FtsQ/DivIB [Paucilactobacillus kaifaensis]